jgi:hypothetical protein
VDPVDTDLVMLIGDLDTYFTANLFIFNRLESVCVCGILDRNWMMRMRMRRMRKTYLYHWSTVWSWMSTGLI